MPTVLRWTGLEAHALRLALRLTVRAFAEYLGVAVRTVSKWEAGGGSTVPRPDNQAILDTALGQADRDASRRFEFLCSPKVLAPADGEPWGEGGGAVSRRGLVVSAGLTMASGLLKQQQDNMESVSAQDATEWLAWHLWKQSTCELHLSQIPVAVARQLDTHPQVISHDDGRYSFTDPALVDALVAQRVSDDIAGGSAHLLATAQTSHAIDLAIAALTAEDDSVRRGLSMWMRHGATAVLRVNAAGVLAKAGVPDLGDAAISVIRDDADTRHLYVTAVVSRVLVMPWEAAGRIAAAASGPSAALTTELADGRGLWAAERLAGELANPRDAAARWCSAVLLSSLPDPVSDMTRTALVRVVQHEPCRENLRAYATVLADARSVVN